MTDRALNIHILHEAADTLKSATSVLIRCCRAFDIVDGDFRKVPGISAAKIDLTDRYPKIICALEESCSLFCSEWNKIKENEAMLHIVALFTESYNLFRSFVVRLDDLCYEHPTRAESIFGQDAISESLLVILCRFDKEICFYYDYVDGRWDEEGSESDDEIMYPGLSEALKDHMFGLSDTSLDFLIKHQPIALKGTWFGPKNEATYFGKHFGLSCKEMNDAFIFLGKDNKEIKLNYNWNDDNKVDCHSPIYLILEKYRKI